MILAVSKLGGPDWFILVGYFALMLFVGFYFFRYMRAMKDYFSGGNQIPWWLSGVSYYMASFSAFAFVFYSALAYQFGWVAVTLFWVTMPAAFISTVGFANKWRRARIDSPVEYLESRYNSAVRQLFAWQGVPVKLIDDGLKLIATGTFLSVGLGMDLKESMLWSGGIMLAYTFLGGLWAVTVTDFVQFVVLAAAVVALLPLSIIKAGGLDSFLQNSPAGFFKLTHPEYSWIYIVSAVALYTIGWSCNWGLVQKLYCTPNEREARKAGYLVSALNIIGPPLMFVPAMAARQFLPNLADSQWVYPKLCAELLPMGMMGLIIAAMFSATMSTLSSDYNVCASVLTNDVYKRLIRPQASQRELVQVGRIITLVVGIVSIGAAFALVGGKNDKMYRNMVTLFSAAIPPVAIPMLWGLISPRINSRAALTGFVVGMGAGIWLFVACPDEGLLLGAEWKKENAIFWGSALATLASVILIDLVVPTPHAERTRAEKFLARLKLPIGAAPEDAAVTRAKGISPFRVVGISTLLIGLMMLAILPWVDGKLALWLDAAIGGMLTLIGGLVAWFSDPPLPPDVLAEQAAAVPPPIQDTGGFPDQMRDPR